jgi:hypothetical protein
MHQLHVETGRVNIVVAGSAGRGELHVGRRKEKWAVDGSGKGRSFFWMLLVLRDSNDVCRGDAAMPFSSV